MIGLPLTPRSLVVIISTVLGYLPVIIIVILVKTSVKTELSRLSTFIKHWTGMSKIETLKKDSWVIYIDLDSF